MLEILDLVQRRMVNWCAGIEPPPIENSSDLYSLTVRLAVENFRAWGGAQSEAHDVLVNQINHIRPTLGGLIDLVLVTQLRLYSALTANGPILDRTAAIRVLFDTHTELRGAVASLA